MAYSCLESLASTQLDQTAIASFLVIISSSLQTISEQVPNIESNDFLIIWFSSILGCIYGICQKLKNLDVPYPPELNKYFDFLFQLLNYPSIQNVILALGTLASWSNESKSLTPEIAEKLLEIASSVLKSESQDEINEICIFIADLFHSETIKTPNSLFIPHAQTFFQLLLDFLQKPDLNILTISLYMNALSDIVEAFLPEKALLIRTDLLQVIKALRNANIPMNTQKDLLFMDTYVFTLTKLYIALAKIYTPHLYEDTERKAIEREQLLEMHTLIRTFHLYEYFQTNSSTHPCISDFSEKTHLTLINMISNFTKKTSSSSSHFLNRVPARSYLKILFTSQNVSPEVQRQAQKVYKEMSHK